MAEPSARRLRARPAWQLSGLMLACGALAGLGQAPFSLLLPGFAGFVVAFRLFDGLGDRRRALAAGLAFGAGYFALTLHWIVEPFLVDLARHGWMAPFALVLMALGMALFWGGAFALAQGRGRWMLALALTGAELVRAYLLGGFPWAMPAYALVDGLAGQGAAWLGSHGLNLAVFAAAAALAAPRRAPAAALAAVAGVVLALRPLPAPEPSSAKRPLVRLVQPNVPQHQKWDPDFMPGHFARALALTGAEGRRPDLIVWPETSIPAPLGGSVRSRAAMAEAAGGVPVLAGVMRYEDLRIFNSAVLLDPGGAPVQIYDKHHLVPFGEYVPFGDLLGRFGIHGLAAREGDGFSAGPGPQLMDLGPLGKALPLICYEAVFPQDMRGTETRPDLLLQLTNDAWFGSFSGPYQHLVQARMRAIEQGLPLLRAANTGISAVVDGRGRILAALALDRSGVVDATLPAPLERTVYAATGDAPLAALVLGLGLFGLRRRGGRARADKSH
ncbi:apolipoprotein N-acyltransferase [Shimia sp.]|uniref:apolipoprotein N-acyltransferase n=1 Tax=Shimia sp. TaxID=1954381 RepID=UPI003564C17B